MKSSYFFRKKRVECRLLARYAKAGDIVKKGEPILILEVSGALVVLRAAYEAKILFIKDQFSNVERNDVLFEEEVSMDVASKIVDVLHTVEWKESDESSGRPEPKSLKEIEHRPTLSDILGKKVVRGSHSITSESFEGGLRFSKKSKTAFSLAAVMSLLCLFFVVTFNDNTENVLSEDNELSVSQMLENEPSSTEENSPVVLAPERIAPSNRVQLVPVESDVYVVDESFVFGQPHGGGFDNVPDNFSNMNLLVDQDNNFLVGFDLYDGVVLAGGIFVKQAGGEVYCKFFEGEKSYYLTFENLLNGEKFELPLFECGEVDFQRVITVRFNEDQNYFWDNIDEQGRFGPLKSNAFIVSKEFSYVEAENGSRRFATYGMDDVFPLEEYVDENGVSCSQPGVDGIREVAEYNVELLENRTIEVEEFARVKENIKIIFDSERRPGNLDCLPAGEWENRRMIEGDF